MDTDKKTILIRVYLCPSVAKNSSTSARPGADACAPNRVTDIAAAAFANGIACSIALPSASATASAALNVSPAAVVSRTSTL
jgi:hypothetical protein